MLELRAAGAAALPLPCALAVVVIVERGGGMRVRVDGARSSEGFAGATVVIRRVGTATPSLRMAEALRGCVGRPLTQWLLSRPPSPRPPPPARFSPALEASMARAFNGPQLDAARACAACVEARWRRLALVQGPPGTGKTHCVLGILAAAFGAAPPTGRRSRRRASAGRHCRRRRPPRAARGTSSSVRHRTAPSTNSSAASLPAASSRPLVGPSARRSSASDRVAAIAAASRRSPSH